MLTVKSVMSTKEVLLVVLVTILVALTTCKTFPVTAVRPDPPFATGIVPVTLEAKLTKVVDVLFVPPLAIGSVPVTPAVNLTTVSAMS